MFGRVLSGVLLLLAFSLGLADSAAAETHPELKYGYPEQAPRAYTNEYGQPDGYYPRLLKVLLARANMPWRGYSYPAARLMHNLQSGETTFSILVKNPILDNCCFYSKNPVWFDELNAYSMGDKPAIKRKEDLIGKSVIVLSGFSYGGLISFINDPQNRIKIHPANSHIAAFLMLEAGRADYLIDYAEPAIHERLGKSPIAGLRSDLLDVTRMYFVISRQYPNAEATLERLESLYAAMRAEDKKREYTK